MYCNYKETNSSYNVIAERNSPQSLPNAGDYIKMFVWNFEEACAIFQIVAVIRSANKSKFLNNAITVICNYTVIIL